MRIDFNNAHIVKALAKKLVREVRSWGDTIKWMAALTVVARAFGHDDYTDFVKRIGFAEPSLPDQSVSPEEAASRYEQYISIIADNDFTRDEAVKIVNELHSAGWWGYAERREMHPKPMIEPSRNRMEFRDVAAVERFSTSLRLALTVNKFKTSIGARKLSAKLFGYDDYGLFEASAGRGIPTPSDFYVSPEELDRRVEEYLRVLNDVGLDENQAIRLLYEVGAEGWWHLRQTNAGPDVRQARFADRIEGTGRPTWRPDGNKNWFLHRTQRPPKKAAYILFENNYPHDEVHLWALLPGEEMIGYCDDALADLFDRLDLSVRTEVASIYREILAVPKSIAEFLVVQDGNGQRVTELEIASNTQTRQFEDYAAFVQQGGMPALIGASG